MRKTPSDDCLACIELVSDFPIFAVIQLNIGTSVKEEFHQWYTNYLSREFKMLVFGHDGYPVILFPTSQGHYFENKDFGMIDAASELIEAGKVKIYCPDSIDSESWYNYGIHPADRIKTHNGYENVILHDIVDFAKHETGHDKIAVAGCSFGAYHAANFAFRHPDHAGYLICMGGAYDIRQFIHGHYDDNAYYNNPPDYLPNLDDNWYLDNIKRMGIILGTGEADICLEDNKRLSGILTSKGIPHWLDIKPGAGHDWNWWREMFPEYLDKIG